MNEIDWERLRRAALDAASTAYAPYSGLKVGAAGVTPTGTTLSGCNVENASYGMTLCAECGLVSALRRAGEQSLTAVAVANEEGHPLMPCGRCRQLLLENGGPDLLVDARPQPLRLGELLPAAFDDATLRAERGPTDSGGMP